MAYNFDEDMLLGSKRFAGKWLLIENILRGLRDLGTFFLDVLGFARGDSEMQATMRTRLTIVISC